MGDTRSPQLMIVRKVLRSTVAACYRCGMNLRQRYEELTPAQRVALAKSAGINAGYLWQIATHWQDRRPSIDLMAKLAKVDRKLSMRDMVAEFTKVEA